MRLRPVYRVTVFVPPDGLRALQDGILAVDPLRFGDYDQGMWIGAVGEEQYRPLPGARPAAGRIGELSRLPSVRVEFLLPRDPTLLARMLREGVRAHHPWEAPTIFVDETSVPDEP